MGYTHAIDSLKGVLITLGTSIGAVMLVYGGIKFAMAFRQMDQQGEHQAVYSVVAGGVLLGLGALGEPQFIVSILFRTVCILTKSFR